MRRGRAEQQRRPVTAPSAISLRSLEDNLPGPSSVPHTPSNRGKGSLLVPPSEGSPQSSSTPPASRSTSSRVSVSGHPTVSSLTKVTTKKEVVTTKTRLVSTPSKRTPSLSDVGLKKSSTIGKASNLPLDSLCLCLEKLESVYHVVTCGAVCQHWREAARSDVVWKSLYLKWWQQTDDEGLDLPIHVTLPPGFDSWRNAFISNYSSGVSSYGPLGSYALLHCIGLMETSETWDIIRKMCMDLALGDKEFIACIQKRKILSKEIARGVGEGWLKVRRMLDKHGKRVQDCAPDDAMQRLVERLGLTFHVCINRDPPVRLKGKGNVIYFPSSCLLRYSLKSTSGGLSLATLNSFKVTATSDKLLRTFTVASFTGHNLEMVSNTGASPGPLRLLQQTAASSASLIVGTLYEGVDYGVEFSTIEHGQEQVLLLMASLHLSDLIWTVMELGDGLTPQISRRIDHDHMAPFTGLHNWHVSVQLHTFGKLLWSRHFHQVFWNPGESIAGLTAVFLLISSHEVFSGVLNSPWRTEVFSGELRGVFMLDFTLWDEGSEIAWHCTRAVRTNPAELATVEYGPPGMDGERMHTGVQDENQGVCVSMNLCIPFVDGWNPSVDKKPVVVITDLRFTLTSKFLISWFGRSTA